jgi:hypothetical protein
VARAGERVECYVASHTLILVEVDGTESPGRYGGTYERRMCFASRINEGESRWIDVKKTTLVVDLYVRGLVCGRRSFST